MAASITATDSVSGFALEPYLGGPNGVRAYPVGEGSDARGGLAQLERLLNLSYREK